MPPTTFWNLFIGLTERTLRNSTTVYLNNISYVLGDIFEVPGGGAFLRRIIDYPTGLATAQININFERTDESFYFNDGATEVIESGLYQKTDNGQGVTIYDRVPTESVRHRDQIGPPLVALRTRPGFSTLTIWAGYGRRLGRCSGY